VNASINEMNLRKLIPFIRSSRYLIELDLSWNGFRTKNLLEFFDAIGDNKQLQHLNLSWNNLIDKSDMTPIRGGAIAGDIKPEDEIKDLMVKVVEKAQKILPPPPSEDG
jgi:Leucine Rich Repeat/Leucine Rich repeat